MQPELNIKILWQILTQRQLNKMETFKEPLKTISRGRNISNIRSVARRCWTSICDSLAMAQGHKSETKKSGTGGIQISRKIRDSTKGSNRKAGLGHQSDGGNEFRIREQEKKFIENKRKIESLESVIVDHIVSQINEGRLYEIPAVSGMTQFLPGGVELNLMHVSPGFDIFLCTANEGAYLKAHSHVQQQTIYVLKGKVWYQRGDDKEQVVSEGDRLVIPANETHTVKLKEDSKYIVVYKPPISFNPLKKEGWVEENV